MRPVSKKKTKPEDKIRADIKLFLEMRGWFVVIVHGGLYMSGMPDLYSTHKKYGPRWIEVKLPNMEGSSFTAAQLTNFPKLIENGTPVWILTAAVEAEYKKLFQPSNFLEYMLRKL